MPAASNGSSNETSFLIIENKEEWNILRNTVTILFFLNSLTRDLLEREEDYDLSRDVIISFLDKRVNK